MNKLKSVELEQALIGGLLLNNAAIDEVAALLQPEHLCEEAHAAIYHDIINLSAKGTVDATLLAPRYANHRLLRRAGFGQYLEDLQAAAPQTAPLVDYARTLLDLYKRRALIAEFQEKAERLMDTDQGFEEVVSDLEGRLTHLETTGYGAPILSLESVQDMAASALEESLQSGERGQGMRFERLTAIAKNLMPGNLVIIAARPAMGKTAFATEISLNFATKGKKTLFATLEMSNEELLERIAAKDLQISFLDVGDYADDADQQRKIFDWLRQKQIHNFWISDLSAPSFAQIRAIAKKQKKTQGLDFLIIDYLQLMSGPQKAMSEFAVTEYNSKALKSLAKELKICIICLSQLSRAVESRDDKCPRMQDLRNSGSIEQDADKILMLYREAYYLEQELPALIAKAKAGRAGAAEKLAEVERALERQKNILSVNIVKNRRGPTGSADIGWDAGNMRFWNL